MKRRDFIAGLSGAMAKQRGDDPKSAILDRFTNNDLRRVVRSALASMDIPHEIAEACLGHGHKALARVYNTHRYEPQVRTAMTRWADRLREIVKLSPALPPTAGNVVVLQPKPRARR